MTTLISRIEPQTRAAFAALFRLSWPVIASRVGVMLMALMDTIIVGQHSSAQLGYLTLAQALHWVPALTSMGLLMGVQVKTSHFIGAGDLHRVGAVFQRGIGYALMLGIGFMALLLLGGTHFLGLVVKPDMVAGAHLPLILFACSIPVFLPGQVGSLFLEALGRTRDTLIATLIANALNVALLLLLVPGHVTLFGIHFEGAMGAATATLIARGLQSAGLLIHILRLKETKPFDLLGRQEKDHHGAAEQRHVGYATGAAYFIEVGAFAGMTMFAGHIGEIEVASWTIVLNYASVVFMVPMGLSAGCSVLVGKAFGAGDFAALARMGRVSFISAGAFTTAVVIFTALFAGTISRFYSHDPHLLPNVKMGLLLSCFFFIPDGLQVVAAQALRARRDILAPTVIHYVSYGAIMLPLGFVFSIVFGWGVAGLVWAVVAASLISGTFQTARFLWLDRRAAVMPAA
ncbi:MATE family efflux transporter [Asticcacaulis taihuensis]|uniref:Multidrug resistance protein, MATE family n=1 Tax=Asticcacaulis taihuensis TaxID=260084 RepID=A0A1G4Q4B6_9CAUL|nr:MATE family efflux transporter [Asticcacaulis taihuensis]SCW39440.1 multidrug resistance protein, MATE family [Asticcacaulis taihuensis]